MADRIKLLALALACAGLTLACGEDADGGAEDAAGGAGGAGAAGGMGGVGGAGNEGGVGGVGGAGNEGGGGAGNEGGVGGVGGAGNEGGGGAGNEGGGVPMCDAVLDLEETCDVANDCCDRGLTCAELSAGMGTCLRTCDANAEVTRCGPRELCNPADPDVPADEPSPGICIPGDDCQPGLEEAVCGGPATCASIEPASFCVPPGSRQVGEACGITFNEPLTDNCAAGLVCELGACRAPCGEGDACGEGERCINFSDRLDGLDFKFCFAGCNVMTQQGCDDPAAVCVASTEGPDGTFLGFCLTEEGVTNGTAGQDEVCTENEQTYWGSCTAGYLCQNIFGEEGDPARCYGWCDNVDRSLCVGGSVCVQGIFGRGLSPSGAIGLCWGECNAFNNEGCGAGEKCGFNWIGVDADGQETIAGLCSAGEANVPTGGRCTSDEETGENNCEVGHLCATLAQGAPPECVKLCADDPDSEFGCPPGTVCNTGLFGGDPNTGEGANDYIGACIPGQ